MTYSPESKKRSAVSSCFTAKPRDYLGIQCVFRYLNSRVQTFRRVVRQNLHFTLRNDVAVVDFLVDVMDGAAGDTFPGGESLFPRFQSGKFWQQRWMNIDNSARKRLQHRRFQDAHEPGEDDEFDIGLVQHSNKFNFGGGFESGLKVTRRQIRVWDGEFARDLEDWRIKHVRNDHARARRQRARANALHNHTTIRAFAGA